MNYPKDAMARANLYVIQRKADMMIDMMPRGQEPPPWIEDNLATARTLMQQVCSYYLWLNNDAEAQQLSQQMDMEDMQAMLPAMQAMVPSPMQQDMPPRMPTPEEEQMAAQIGAGCGASRLNYPAQFFMPAYNTNMGGDRCWFWR